MERKSNIFDKKQAGFRLAQYDNQYDKNIKLPMYYAG